MIKFYFKKIFIIFVKVNLIFLIFFSKSYGEMTNKNNSLIILGSDAAPIKIKIFSSLTCPHCASFHIQVIPKIKKEYVETGKVQLIFLDFPLDQLAFNASKLLHCMDKEKQIIFLDKIYETQNKWTLGSDIITINNNLKDIVEKFGINSMQFDKCLNNEIIADKILSERIDAQKKYAIDSTPTVIINEKKLKGSADFKNIKKKIEKLI
tara:strand:- start:739 stop:1362 length:624 start_codon:yes stop_codon:yes gene_type:complete